MTEEGVLQWLLVALGCYFAYHGARLGAATSPLTWPAVFGTGIWITFAFWIGTAFVYGRAALIAAAAFVLAIVIGAKRGTAALLVLAVLCVGCGGEAVTPTSPTPPARPVTLAGDWHGTLAMTLDDTRTTLPVTATISQSADNAILAWITVTGGTITGTLTRRLTSPYADATLTGSLDLETASTDPAKRCHGTGAMGGTLTPINWRAAELSAQDCEGTMRDVVLSLTR